MYEQTIQGCFFMQENPDFDHPVVKKFSSVQPIGARFSKQEEQL
jgi:hypothetical protein